MNKQFEYAGFVVRLSAYTLDFIIIGLPVASIIVLLFGLKADIATTLITGLLFSLLITRHGATPGKKIAGLRVVSKEGVNPTFMEAFLREFVGKFISGIVLGLGYFWVIFDKEKQGWHDKIAGTHVVIVKPLAGSKKVIVYFITAMVISLSMLLLMSAAVLVAKGAFL